MYNELLSIAQKKMITGREHFRLRPIHWVIDLSAEGKPLSFSPTVNTLGKRGKQFRSPKNYHMQFKDKKIQSVCTNQNNWLPDFLVYPADEIFPGGVNKSTLITLNKRLKTMALIIEAAKDLPHNKVIKAIIRFIYSHPKFEAVFQLYEYDENTQTILKALKGGKENISFRVNGTLSSSNQELLDWWRLRILQQRKYVLEKLPTGNDFIWSTEEPKPLAEFFPSVLGGTPMISYNKAPFQSFGMGSQTTPMQLENAEKCAEALNTLCNDPDSSLRLSDMQAIFWTNNSESSTVLSFSKLVEEADPLIVKDFLESPWGGIKRNLPEDTFHSAMLKKTKGRFSVRHWYISTLPEIEKNLRNWFGTIATIVNISKNAFYPCTISDLAKCTVTRGKKSKPAPRVYSELFNVALFGHPLPTRLFHSAIQRQCVELAKGFDPKTKSDFENRLRARTTLIKLFFELNKGGERINMENHHSQKEVGYLCGRLLAMLDKIHIEAHKGSGGTNASPANRSYAAASTTPGIIFPQLCKLTRYHLNKIGGGWANCLEHGYEAVSGEFIEGLKQIVANIQETSGENFPRTLSLEQQGKFAIGFYFERCRTFPKSKEKSDNPKKTS